MAVNLDRRPGMLQDHRSRRSGSARGGLDGHLQGDRPRHALERAANRSSAPSVGDEGAQVPRTVRGMDPELIGMTFRKLVQVTSVEGPAFLDRVEQEPCPCLGCMLGTGEVEDPNVWIDRLLQGPVQPIHLGLWPVTFD